MPPRSNRNDRIRQDVTDISDASQLLRYAAASQLEPLLIRGITQGRIAQGADLGANKLTAGPVLAKALGQGLNARQLRGLDEIITALTPDPGGNTGGLSSLALRLSAGRRERAWESSLVARVPPGWTRKILTGPAGDEVGVLMQASALLSEFMAAGRMDAADAITGICDHYSKEMELLVRQLILISVAPPTSRNYDAQILLGMLASYAFNPMKEQLDRKLRYSPMSFRVWRAVTKLVMLSQDTPPRELQGWIWRLIRDAGKLRAVASTPAGALTWNLLSLSRTRGLLPARTGSVMPFVPGRGTARPPSGNAVQHPWGYGSGRSARAPPPGSGPKVDCAN